MRRKIKTPDGQAAIEAYLAGSASNEQLATGVRFLLEELGSNHPGNAVEVRIPPFGAVQCIKGPSHSRGTPANVVEMDPESWIELCLGRLTFEQLLTDSKLSASGNRSDLAGLFPIFVA
ncbi:unannotated protein [freshwater metagenome]|uniref:Unannotated protein n=1 Tax=freshwater metagenome TaxID=449393 RepID=A0A6J6JJF6_9ZZZZ|nr:hypothetical protein [Actinomycetota bacterium]